MLGGLLGGCVGLSVARTVKRMVERTIKRRHVLGFRDRMACVPRYRLYPPVRVDPAPAGDGAAGVGDGLVDPGSRPVQGRIERDGAASGVVIDGEEARPGLGFGPVAPHLVGGKIDRHEGRGRRGRAVLGEHGDIDPGEAAGARGAFPFDPGRDCPGVVPADLDAHSAAGRVQRCDRHTVWVTLQQHPAEGQIASVGIDGARRAHDHLLNAGDVPPEARDPLRRVEEPLRPQGEPRFVAKRLVLHSEPHQRRDGVRGHRGGLPDHPARAHAVARDHHRMRDTGKVLLRPVHARKVPAQDHLHRGGDKTGPSQRIERVGAERGQCRRNRL